MNTTETLTFQRETLFPELHLEVAPLLAAHWAEIAYYREIPLDVDWAVYRQCEQAQTLRIFTVRLDGRLEGYAAFFVRAHPHYQQTMWAAQDVLYLSPILRRDGTAARFVRFCEDELSRDGIHVITHHMKAAAPHRALFERLGYDTMDVIYSKRL